MTYVELGCRCLIGLVFLASVSGKVRGRGAYAGFVAATRRLAPGWLARAVPTALLAGGVVIAEAAVPVLLALPVLVGPGFVLAAGLLVGFAAAIVPAVRRRDRTPCRCFGASARPVGGVHIVRNLLLAAVAGLGLAAGVSGDGTPQLAGGLAGAAAGAVLAVLAVTADDIAELFRPLARAGSPAAVPPGSKGVLR